MVPVSRRRLLAATGTVALAGCLSRGDDDPDESPDLESLDDASLPEELAAVLGALPDNVGGDAAGQVIVAAPAAEDDDGAYGTLVGDVGQRFGLADDAIDRVATATYDDYDRELLVAAGSFAASDVDVSPLSVDGASGSGEGSASATASGSQAGDDSDAADGGAGEGSPEPAADGAAAASESGAGSAQEDVAVHAEDGFAILASGDDEPWDGGLEAAKLAHGDPDLGLLAQKPLAAVLDPLADESPIFLVPSFTEEELPENTDVDAEPVDLAAVTRSQVDETTEETTFVFLFSSADAADEDVVDELIESGISDREFETESMEQDGPRIVTTIRAPLPEHQLPDDSPNLHARFWQREDGLQLEFSGEESADPANLEYRVDGEAVDPPWAGDGTIEPGATYSIDLDLFATASVVWIDPERDGVEHSLGQYVHAPHDAFEHSYDLDARRMTITYTGDESIDASRFELRRDEPLGDASEPSEESLDERLDELASGDEIVLEDVQVGEYVSLRVDVGDHTRHVYSAHARPPGAFEHVREDGQSFLVYRGEESRPADEFAVHVDEEPIATQWTDEYETLTSGDRLAIDLALGTDGTVVWTGGEEPVPVRRFTIAPDVEFAFDYDETAGEVTVTHDGGEALPADGLAVELHPPASDQPGTAWDASGTVSEGDEVVVDVPEETREEDRNPIVAVTYGDMGLDHAELGRDEE